LRRSIAFSKVILALSLLISACMPKPAPTPQPSGPALVTPTFPAVQWPEDPSYEDILGRLEAEGFPDLGEPAPFEPIQVYYMVPTWMSNEAEASAVAFNAEYEGIWQAKVQTYDGPQQLRQVLESGEEVDVIKFFELASPMDLALEGWLDIGMATEIVLSFGGGEAMATEAKRVFSDGTPYAGGFLPGLLELCRDPLTGDGYAVVPVSGSVAGLWYRRDILAANGINPPEDWDSLLQAAQNLRGWGGLESYGIALPQQWPALFLHLLASQGISIADDSGNFLLDQSSFHEAWRWYSELSRWCPEKELTWLELQDRFASGQVAMIHGSSVMLPSLRQYGLTDKIGFMPTLEGQAGRTSYGWLMTLGTIASDDPRRREAAKALAYHILLSTPTDVIHTPALNAWAIDWRLNQASLYPPEIVDAIYQSMQQISLPFMLGGYNPVAAAFLTSPLLPQTLAPLPLSGPQEALQELLTQTGVWQEGLVAKAALKRNKAKEEARAPTRLEQVLKYCEEKKVTVVTDLFKEGQIGRDVEIHFVPKNDKTLDGAIGATTKHDGIIHIYLDDSLSAAAAASTLRHELQHAIQWAPAARQRLGLTAVLYLDMAKQVTSEKGDQLLWNPLGTLKSIYEETHLRVKGAWMYGRAKRFAEMTKPKAIDLYKKLLAREIEAHLKQRLVFVQLKKAGIDLVKENADPSGRFLDAKGNLVSAEKLKEQVEKDYAVSLVNSINEQYGYWNKLWEVLLKDSEMLKGIYDRYGEPLERSPDLPD